MKFIGDEVMFTTRTAASGLEAAVALSELFKQHPRIPPVRVGLAFGPVLTREGDCFGSVVNLAARIVTVAEQDSILIESTLRAQLSAPEWEFEDAGSSFLKGFNSPVSLFRVAKHIAGADIDSTPARPKPLTPGRCPSTGTRSWRQESHSERLVQRGRIGKKVEPWKSEIC